MSMTTPFPQAGSIRYSFRDRSWIAVWDEAPECLHRCPPPVFAPEPADAEWVQLGDVDCIDMKLPPGMRLSMLVGDVGTETLCDGVPLLVQENLFSLRQPLRFSFAQQVERAKATVRRYEHLPVDAPVYLPMQLRRSFVRDTLASTAALAYQSIDTPRCDESALCPCYFRDAPVKHELTTLCGACKESSYRLEVCCEEAIPQRLPSVPRSSERLFFMDFVCPGGRGHGNFSTAAMARDINSFDAHQALVYSMTCNPECVSKADHWMFRAVFAPVVRVDRVPIHCATCPAEVTELVCEYLGRRTVAMLMAPLFNYSCSVHPSPLDRLYPSSALASLHRLPWWRRTPDARIRRIAETSHYYHVLTLWCISHQARVDAVRALYVHVGEVITEAFARLVAPSESLVADHVLAHSTRRSHWLLLFQVCHDPSAFLRARYNELDAEGNRHCRRAHWSLLLWPLLVSAIGIQSTPGRPSRFLMYHSVLTTELGRRWSPRIVLANVLAGSTYLALDLLHQPMSTADSLCEPQCCPDAYTQVVANWVAITSRRAWGRGTKRARRHLMATDPWNRLFFGQRDEVFDSDGYDSDATEPYYVSTGDTTEDELGVERIEETDDE